MAKKLASIIVKGRWIIIALYVGLMAFSFWAMDKIDVNYDLSKYLPEDSSTQIAIRIMDEEFGLSGQAEVMVKNVSVEEAMQLQERLAGLDNVVRVTFLNNSSYFYDQDGDGVGYALFKIIINENDYSMNAENLLGDIESELELYDIVLNGGSLHAFNLKTRISNEMLIMVTIAVLVVALVLILSSKSWLEPVIFGATIGVSILINMGTNIMFGEISYIIKSITAILQMALCLDYSIITMHNYQLERQTNANAEDAMINALAKAFSPVSASSITTVAGIAAIMFMTFRIGLDIGQVMVKAILISMFTTFLLMPGLIVILAKPTEKLNHAPFKIFDRKPDKPKKDFNEGYAKLLNKSKKLVPILMIVVIVVAYVLQTQLTYEYSEGHKNRLPNEVVTVFGESNQVHMIVPKATEENGGYEKQRQMVEILSRYLNSNGDPALKDVLGYNTTIALEVTAEDAAILMNIDKGLVNIIYGSYYLEHGMVPDNKMNLAELIDYVVALVNGEKVIAEGVDINELLGEDIASYIMALQLIINNANKQMTATELTNLIKGLDSYGISLDINKQSDVDASINTIDKKIVLNGENFTWRDDLNIYSGNIKVGTIDTEAKEFTLKGARYSYESGTVKKLTDVLSEYVAMIYGMFYFDEYPLDSVKLSLKEFINYTNDVIKGNIKTGFDIESFIEGDLAEKIDIMNTIVNNISANLKADELVNILESVSGLIDIEGMDSFKTYIYFIYGNYGFMDPTYKSYTINIKVLVDYLEELLKDEDSDIPIGEFIDQEEKDLVYDLNALFKAMEMENSSEDLTTLLNNLLNIVPDFDLKQVFIDQVYGNYYYDNTDNELPKQTLMDFILYVDSIVKNPDWSFLIDAELQAQIEGLRFLMVDEEGLNNKAMTANDFYLMMSDPRVLALTGVTLSPSHINVIYSLFLSYYNNYTAYVFGADVIGQIYTEEHIIYEDPQLPEPVIIDRYTLTKIEIGSVTYVLDGANIYDYMDRLPITTDTPVGAHSSYWMTFTLNGDDMVYSYNNLAGDNGKIGDVYIASYVPDDYYIIDEKVYERVAIEGSFDANGNFTFDSNSDSTLDATDDYYFVIEDELFLAEQRGTMSTNTITIDGETYSHSSTSDEIREQSVIPNTGIVVGYKSETQLVFTAGTNEGNTYDTVGNNIYLVEEEKSGYIGGSYVYLGEEGQETRYAILDNDVYGLNEAGTYADNKITIGTTEYLVDNNTLYDNLDQRTGFIIDGEAIQIYNNLTKYNINGGAVYDYKEVVNVDEYDALSRTFTIGTGAGRKLYFYRSDNVTGYLTGMGTYENWNIEETVKTLYVNTADFFAFLSEVGPELMGVEGSYWNALALLGSQTTHYSYQEMSEILGTMFSLVGITFDVNQEATLLLYNLYYFTKNPATNYDPYTGQTYDIIQHNLLKDTAEAERVLVFSAKLLNSNTEERDYYDSGIYNSTLGSLVGANYAPMLINAHKVYLEINFDNTSKAYDIVADDFSRWMETFNMPQTDAEKEEFKELIRQVFIMYANENGFNGIANGIEEIVGKDLVGYLIGLLKGDNAVLSTMIENVIAGYNLTINDITELLNIAIDNETERNFSILYDFINNYIVKLGVDIDINIKEVLKQAYILYNIDKVENPEFLNTEINMDDFVAYIKALTTETNPMYSSLITGAVEEHLASLYNMLGILERLSSEKNILVSTQDLSDSINKLLGSVNVSERVDKEEISIIYLLYSVTNNYAPITSKDAISYSVTEIVTFIERMLDKNSNSYNDMIAKMISGELITTDITDNESDEYKQKQQAIIDDLLYLLSIYQNVNALYVENALLSYTEMSDLINGIVDAVLAGGIGDLLGDDIKEELGGEGDAIDPFMIMQVYIQYLYENDKMPNDPLQVQQLVGYVLNLIDTNDTVNNIVGEDEKTMLDDYAVQLEEGKKMFDGEHNSRIIFVLSIKDGSQEAFDFVELIRDVAKIVYGEEETYLAGNTVGLNDISKVFSVDMLITGIISILAILLVVAFIYRSLLMPIILVIIIQSAIWISFSFNVIMGNPMFFMAYILVTCIQMGATIDYGIILSGNYVEARKIMPKHESMVLTLKNSIKPILISGFVITIAAKIIGIVSTSIAVSTIGNLLSRGTIVSVTLVLVLLPMLLLLFDKAIEKTTFKTKFIHEDEPTEVSQSQDVLDKVTSEAAPVVENNEESNS